MDFVCRCGLGIFVFRLDCGCSWGLWVKLGIVGIGVDSGKVWILGEGVDSGCRFGLWVKCGLFL